MIGVPAALLVGAFLLLLLILMATRGSAVAREASRSDSALLDDEAGFNPCPPEFVSRIFSPDDWQFVSETKCPRLEKLFRRERRLVALVWVHHTSTAIRRIMREHTEAARQSHDLHFATETKIVLLYAELMLLCSILFLAIQSAGPQRLGGLAAYADSLSRRIAQTRDNFKTVTTGPEFHGAESS
jgi:hypothetical protein